MSDPKPDSPSGADERPAPDEGKNQAAQAAPDLAEPDFSRLKLARASLDGAFRER